MNFSPSDHGLGYLVKQESVAVAGGDALQIRSLLDKQQFHDPQGTYTRRFLQANLRLNDLPCMALGLV